MLGMAKSAQSSLEEKLHGNTLAVYLLLLERREALGPREVQRELGFSSPSVAAHHLAKLVDLEICERTVDNKYQVSEIVKVGVYKQYLTVRGRFIPRFAFHVTFFSTLLLLYGIFVIFTPPGLFDRFVTFFSLTLALLFNIWEFKRLLRERRE